ncbi:MAG: M10 family metallopeptidase [Sphingomicrobium sp.]
MRKLDPIEPVDTTDVRPTVGALTPIADAAGFNETFDWETSAGLPLHVGDLVGTTVNGKPVLPEGGNVPGTVSWQIDAGWAQDVSDGIITYGFFDARHAVGLNNNPSYGEGAGYSPFTAAQRTAARTAIQTWDDLIAARFVEVPQGPGVSSWAQNTTDILLANTTTGPAQAWAYYPGYGQPNQRVAGDVWIADPRMNSSNNQLLPGQYGVLTLNHELGHSLGLSHPGNYNFSDDSDGDGVADPISYTSDAQYFQDSSQFSIMSYFDSYETGAQNIDFNFMRFLYASTPMVDDVYVAQQKYGADFATRSGNTTYGFNFTSDVTNEAMKFRPGEMATIFTIWDGAGNDTLDLSGYYTPSVIDLREGAYSSAGGWGSYNPLLLSIDPAVNSTAYLAAVNAYNSGAGLGARTAAYDLYFGGRSGVNEGIPWSETTGASDGGYLMEQNIGIAYGAIIENAVGGHGADRINGNQANNSFFGGDGADTFIIADYSGTIPIPSNPNGRVVTDTSADTILDFHSGEDKIDLTAFGASAVSGLSYNGTDLQFSANGHGYTVHLNGAVLNIGVDILLG